MIESILKEVRSAAAQLEPLFPVSETLDDRALESADAAVDGVALVHYLGDHYVKIGRKNTCWQTPERGIQLNAFVFRTAFIGDLANAFAITGKTEYAEAARDYLESYIASWPLDHIGEDERADSTLDMSGRNTTWAQSLHKLAGAACFDENRLNRIVDFIAGQLTWLQANMKTTINWRVFEARGLLLSSLYLRFHEGATSWQRHAVRVLNDAWHRQFLADGVHIECNPIYHGGMAETFLGLYKIGLLFPDLGFVMDLEKFRPMYDFSLACVKPNGYLCGIHDSQSEFTGHLRDGIHIHGHKAVDKEKEWKEFRQEFDLGLDYPPTSQFFPDAGLAFVRTGWDEDALWMSFDATNWGSGHCHLSRNALQLHAHRQSMVIDPGWLEYDNSDWGCYGRTTRAHSTCNLNGSDQIAINPRTFKHYCTDGYDAFFSVYEGGYWDTKLAWTFGHADKGIWAEHSRLVLRVSDRFVFVADSMLRIPHDPTDPTEDRPSFECVWQLAPDAVITADETDNQVVARWSDAGLLLLAPIRPEGSRFEVHEGELDPIRGWVSGNDKHRPAPQLVVNAPKMNNQHDYFVSVLMPFAGSEVPEVEVESASPLGTTGFVHLRWKNGTSDIVHWGCNLNLMLGVVDGIDTDSSLVHLSYDAGGKITGGCCVNGTYCEPFTDKTLCRPETFLLVP